MFLPKQPAWNQHSTWAGGRTGQTLIRSSGRSGGSHAGEGNERGKNTGVTTTQRTARRRMEAPHKVFVYLRERRVFVVKEGGCRFPHSAALRVGIAAGPFPATRSG